MPVWSRLHHSPGGVVNLSPPTAVFKADHHAYFVEYGKHGGLLYIEWRADGAPDSDIVIVRLLHADGRAVPSSQVQLFHTKRESEEALAARPLLHAPPPSELHFRIMHEVAKIKLSICAAEADVKGNEYYLEFQHRDQHLQTCKGEACRTQRFRCHSRNKEASSKLVPRSLAEEKLFQRAHVLLEQLASMPEEAVRLVIDPLTNNIEILEQLVHLAKAAHAQQTPTAAATATAVMPACAGSSSGTDAPMVPAAPDPPAAGGSSFDPFGSYESASQGSATPMQSDASPTGSDTEEDADQASGIPMDTGSWDALIDEFFPSTSTGCQDMDGPAGGYRSMSSRRAGGTLKIAEAFSDQLGAFNSALSAKLNVTVAA